ncbi:MAG TPA: hypothetical protein PLR74_13330, partial [Agriterribacter sp.]|nr:hypothetical protein [Agriterribacter sp.]
MKPFVTALALGLCVGVSRAQCPAAQTIIPEDTLIICADTTFTLSLPAMPGDLYTWSTGATGNSVNIDQQGKYWVTLQKTACPPVTDTVTILFNSLILQPGVKDTLLCLN